MQHVPHRAGIRFLAVALSAAAGALAIAPGTAAADEVPARLTESLTETFDTTGDAPAVDDIESAEVAIDETGTVSAQLVTVESAGATSFEFAFDIDHDEVADYRATADAVIRTADSVFVCSPVIVDTNRIEFPVDCFGSPAEAFWTARTAADVVPDTGHVGPVINDGFAFEGDAELIAVAPHRLLDTRDSGRLAAGSTQRVEIAGRAGVPVDAVAAVVNVAAVNGGADGFLTVFPCNEERPTASTLNYTTGATTSNVALARLSGGATCIFGHADSDVLVDVIGFVPNSSPVNAVAPARLLDSRDLAVVPTAGGTSTIQVAGVAGIPGTATAAMVNITAVAPHAAGHLTAFACDQRPADVAHVSYSAGSVIANYATVPLDPQGRLCVNSTAASDIIVDVAGYRAEPSTTNRPPLVTIADELLLSTDGVVYAGSTTRIEVAGRAGVPHRAEDALLNVTATDASGAGFVTVYPCDQERPVASNINLTAGGTASNSTLVELDRSGDVCVFSLAEAHLAVAVNGYTLS